MLDNVSRHNIVEAEIKFFLPHFLQKIILYIIIKIKYMDTKIKATLTYIQELTKDWIKITSAREAVSTSLTEYIKQKKTSCGMKARFAQFLLTFLTYTNPDPKLADWEQIFERLNL